MVEEEVRRSKGVNPADYQYADLDFPVRPDLSAPADIEITDEPAMNHGVLDDYSAKFTELIRLTRCTPA